MKTRVRGKEKAEEYTSRRVRVDKVKRKWRKSCLKGGNGLNRRTHEEGRMDGLVLPWKEANQRKSKRVPRSPPIMGKEKWNKGERGRGQWHKEGTSHDRGTLQWQRTIWFEHPGGFWGLLGNEEWWCCHKNQPQELNLGQETLGLLVKGIVLSWTEVLETLSSPSWRVKKGCNTDWCCSGRASLTKC